MSSSEEEKKVPKISRYTSPKKTLARTGIADDPLNIILKLAGRDITNSTLNNKNLTNSNYEGYDLTKTNFRDSILTNASFKGATLDDCNFSGAILQGADLRIYNMDNVILNGANLEKANLKNITISGWEIRDTTFHKANLCNVVMKKLVANNTSFSKAKLRGARLELKGGAISFEGADLSAANISFTKSDELNVILNGASLAGADLGNCKIVDQEVKNTDFSASKFRDLEAERVVFTDCEFVRSVLIGARFSYCTFNRVIFDYSTINAELDNCQFNNCSFRGVTGNGQIVFTGVKMLECTFDRCKGDTFEDNNILDISFNNEGAKFLRCKFIGNSLSLSDTSDYFKLVDCEFSEIKLFMKLNGASLRGCSFEEVSISEDSSIDQSKITKCTFIEVKLEGLDLLNSTIKDTSFNGCYIKGCRIEFNNIIQTTFEGIHFNDTNVEDNKLEEVKFKEIEMKEGTFLNNGEDGYIFIDSHAYKADIGSKDIPGLVYQTDKVTIKTKN
jgi:uncharacterized protein YjbI with pentapeptide repeats